MNLPTSLFPCIARILMPAPFSSRSGYSVCVLRWPSGTSSTRPPCRALTRAFSSLDLSISLAALVKLMGISVCILSYHLERTQLAGLAITVPSRGCICHCHTSRRIPSRSATMSPMHSAVSVAMFGAAITLLRPGLTITSGTSLLLHSGGRGGTTASLRLWGVLPLVAVRWA